MGRLIPCQYYLPGTYHSGAAGSSPAGCTNERTGSPSGVNLKKVPEPIRRANFINLKPLSPGQLENCRGFRTFRSLIECTMTNVTEKPALSKRDESPASFRYVRTWSTMAGYAACIVFLCIGCYLHNEVKASYKDWVIIGTVISIIGAFHVPAILRKEGAEE
jgi:hypothetical protein